MTVEDDREACWKRFLEAADAYLHNNDPNPAKAFLTRVRGMFGDEVAEQQATELRNWVKARQK